MTCPHCKLINPPSALRCDCGYDFKLRSVESSYLADRRYKAHQEKSLNLRSALKIGVLLFIAMKLLLHLIAAIGD